MLSLLNKRKTIYGKWEPTPLSVKFVYYIFTLFFLICLYIIIVALTNLNTINSKKLGIIFLGVMGVIYYSIFFYLYYCSNINTSAIITQEHLILPRLTPQEVWRYPPIPFERIEGIYTNPHSDGMIFIFHDRRGRRRVKRVWKKSIGEEGDEELSRFLDILREKGVKIIEKDYYPEGDVKIER